MTDNRRREADFSLPIGLSREAPICPARRRHHGRKSACGLQSVTPRAVKFVCFRTNRLFSCMETSMILRFLAVALFAVTTVSSQTAPSLPSSFQQRTIHSPEGADIFVRLGGSGPVVVLIHGYAENSDSWAPLAADLMKDHTVVVPDLRGIGRSSKPADGYDKKTQAKDIRAVVIALGYDKTFVVAHDIGNMVAYAYAATFPDKVERLVVMDAPIPGIDPWNEILQNPGVWHFNFHGQDMERLYRRSGST